MSQSNDHVADLADDYLHKLLDPARAAEVQRHCETCPACAAALDDARRRLTALRAAPATEAAEPLVHKTMAKVEAHRQTRKRHWRRFIWATGAALAASVLLLAGFQIYTANLSATPYDLVVLGQRDLLASTTNSLRVLLRDPKTLAPLANIPVTLQLADHANNKTADLGSFTTDANGDGQPRFTLPDWPDASYDLRVVAQTPIRPETADLTVTLKRESKVMLSTDKPVYQPGQTIHVRSLTLRRPDLRPLAGEAAAFSVVDPKGNVVYKLLDKTSRFGIAAADCPLDNEILEGAYTVQCKVGDVESRLSVEVKKYVLPKFKVAVTTDKPFYKPGDTIKLTVQADYFFGKPVADAEVKVDAKDDTPGGVSGVLEGRTDAKGAAHFDFVLLPLILGQKAPPSEPAHVHFQAAATDSAGQKQVASAVAAVSDWPAQIEVLPEAGELVQGVPNKLYVLVTRLDGRPVARAHVTLTGVTNGEPDKTDTEKIDADENGAAVGEITPMGGSILKAVAMEASARNDQGEEIARRTVSIPCGLYGDFLLRTDRAVYRGGDTMKLTALGDSASPLFVDLIREGQTLRTETIEMANDKGEMSVDLPPDLSGTVQVVGYRVDAKGWPVRKTRLVYVRPADQVHIVATLDPDKKEYKPGDRPTLRLKLTDNEGKPCPGAVSLAGVDEAVFSVLPQRPGTEQAFYTLDQELMRPVDKIRPWSPDEAGSERYQEALFAAASRTDRVESQPAPPTHTLVAQTYQAKVQQTDNLRATRLLWIKQGWVGLVLTVIFSALLAFWIFGQTNVLVKSLVTGYVVIPLLLVGLAMGLVSAGVAQSGGKSGQNMFLLIDRSASLGVQVEDMPAGMVPDADVDLSNIDRGSDPISSGQSGAPKPRVRELFPETLLWRPELITDDNGTASLPLELADSITTWRLSASAVAADGKLGAAQLPVKVFQDFFVDLNLPVVLTRGDEVGVPVVVYNYLDKPQTVTLTLADADWFTRLDGAEQRLELAPGEVRSVHYRLRVDKVGDHSLTVEARGAADADAVKRSIEVVPDGRVVEQVVNGSLDKPATVDMVLPEGRIPGSEKAFVKIYPSSFSQLVEGLDNIFQMPYGCFEQTSSTTYPNVLALDYLKRTGKSAPAVEAKARAYIHLGYQRLLSFEVAGGGFDWFGNPPANRTLTAYGLMEFTDMARVHDVDPAVIGRTRRWLLSQRRPDGSWDPEDHKMHDDAVAGADDARLAETAYIAWAVYGDPAAPADSAATFAYLKQHDPAAVKDAHTLALVCNALLAVDANNADAAPYLERLEAMKRVGDDGKFAWWEQAPGARTTFYGAGRGGEVETTALAALALIRSGRGQDSTRRALTWLTAQKDPNGTWYSTQATVLALKALLAGTGQPSKGGERVVEVRLNGGVIRTVKLPAEQSDMLKQIDLSAYLKPGQQTLTLTETDGAAVGFAASFRYNEPDAGPAGRKDALAVDLRYDRTELAVGEWVRATARVGTADGTGAAPMVMVELPVPAGFAASADDFAGLVGPGKRIAKVQMRAGSVLLYLTGLDAGQPLTVVYRLRATMPADVASAGARAYEYYDPDKRGSSPATRLTVKARD